jgi:hypothetical protein
MFAYLPEVCTKAQPQGFTCAGARTFYNASVIWGVIGPARMFGAGAMYCKNHHRPFPIFFSRSYLAFFAGHLNKNC